MPSVRPSQVTIDQGLAGQLVPETPIETSTNLAVTVGRMYAMRFVATKSRTITQVKFALSVSAATNDTCDAGIINSAGTVLLGSAGSTAGKLNVTPAVQTLTLTAGVPLVQGTAYYAVWASSGAGGAQVAVNSVGISSVVTLPGSALGSILQTFQSAATFPIAVPFTSGGAIGSVPILFLGE